MSNSREKLEYHPERQGCHTFHPPGACPAAPEPTPESRAPGFIDLDKPFAGVYDEGLGVRLRNKRHRDEILRASDGRIFLKE